MVYFSRKRELDNPLVRTKQLLINEITEATQSPEPRLAKLPFELLATIFHYLGPIPATCFGLTCRRAYEQNRKEYPNPWSLDTVITRHFDGFYSRSKRHGVFYPREREGHCEYLGEVLHTWIADPSLYPLYKPAEDHFQLFLCPSFHFVKIKAYGKKPGRKDRALQQRYRDHCVSRFRIVCVDRASAFENLVHLKREMSVQLQRPAFPPHSIA
jgi:hypothetical protein